MRITTLLRMLVGIQQTVISGFEIVDGALILKAKPSLRKLRCSRCGRICSGYDTLPTRKWRHLDFGAFMVYLSYSPRRVNCEQCGVSTEKIPWNPVSTAQFTTPFEDAVALLAQKCDKTTISKTYGISWQTVGRIIERVLKRYGHEEHRLENLKNIGVDEISYRKKHNYVTVVIDHDTRNIAWCCEGKDSATLNKFFKELGQEKCGNLENISMDMSRAYISSAEKNAPNATIVFDRFHIEKIINEAVDMTRREEWRKTIDNPQLKSSIKGLRWPLLKGLWKCSSEDNKRLAELQKTNMRLYRAYMLKVSFNDILNRKQPNVVRAKLEDWIEWAQRSQIEAFVSAAKTVRAHLDGIVAYIRHRLTNGIVEGLNNKIRVAMRRAFGFHSAEAVMAMINFLCSGIQIKPVRQML